ncbi:hypothetical protein SAMN05192588_0997 [Nonlabens sp. Hel1_33_55]|uniref:hypothetical protein n=1 Tax=Nonlabens sp. Hel1_33_55 TaxID=1336802 RepID=UPI000875D9B1|nr:hypothetical protein [Nonlabens sp. Hel1_33_55]SCY07245.1 hypothetical protein SAMN05192588_0997 [Nonlabens sp. Hel1_33_55]
MCLKVIKSDLKKELPTGFGKLLMHSSDEKNSIKSYKEFNSLISMNEVFINPGSGILPYEIKNIFKLVIPLQGVCAERLNNQDSTQVSVGEVQMIKYPDVAFKMEYNPNNEKALNYLILEFDYKRSNSKYKSEIFNLEYKSQNFNKILSAPIDEDENTTITLKAGNFKKDAVDDLVTNNNAKARIVYVINGSISLTNTDKILAKSDSIFYSKKKQLGFKAQEDSNLLMIEIS